MRVIGTAGHVDHGKSSLVAALTGIHPDRLKEEQAREMTIELGFAWLTLPDGEEVGIVDVPGHRDFIENMLAGVGGIDAVLFVIAADEGVMPQTREHLAILDILDIRNGVIVLTKIDLIDEPEWLELVEQDVRRTLQGTVLANAPLARVSSRSREGLSQLMDVLTACLGRSTPRPDLGRPRLPVDRVFTISGFGTVVTGTLLDGSLRLGDEVEILPGGLRGRVRGLQSHKRKEDVALPGRRTAINISGVNVDQVKRGDVLALPGKYRPTSRVDVSFRLLPDASSPLRHDAEVKMFLGSAEAVARLRLLAAETLNPGEEGWLQLELKQPLTAARGDRYILRRPSPGETLGGGVILDPQPAGRHKRFSADVIRQLEALKGGSPSEVVFQALQSGGMMTAAELAERARLSKDQTRETLGQLLERGQVVELEGGAAASQGGPLLAALRVWQEASEKVHKELSAYHRANPLRRGLGREELKSRLKMPPRPFSAAMRRWAAEGSLVESGGLVALPEHKVVFNPAQQSTVDRLLDRFAQSPFSPPTIKECQADAGEDVYDALVDLGYLMPVSVEVVFRRQDYETLLREVREILNPENGLTVAEFRDRYNTTRRYALAFLEHLDAIGMTRREGDVRYLAGERRDR